MSEYTTAAGTEPSIDEQHEARTMMRVDGNGSRLMLTEIGDGTFVGWDACAKCGKHVAQCRCATGPQEPQHIEGWRIERFASSFKARGVEPALPVLIRHQDRRVAAVIRLLRSQGWTIEAPPPTKEEIMKLGEESLRRHHPSLAQELDEERATESDDRPNVDEAMQGALDRLRNAKEEEVNDDF